MDLTALNNITPIIQSIDSYETNQKLGIAFEAKVRKGKLFVLCVDPESDIDNRLATRQLITSVENMWLQIVLENTLQSYEIEALFHQISISKSRKDSNSNSAIAK